ncbi:MAG: coenzyme F420-0:L-glutamate ligase [Alphaproteobacteria bacterium]|nr:coenzyme F420-0:L-glutamate ligase [Alphaproteobacteria bacterium]
MTPALSLHALPGIPEVVPGDDIAELIVAALGRFEVRDHDILVVAQKIVSKAEGRLVALGAVRPGPEALALAPKVDKDPRLVELILRESNAVVRHCPGVLVVEQKLGLVMANAGIDHSNVSQAGEDDDTVLLLPVDPDASGRAIRNALAGRLGVDVGIVIADSIGRAWRTGTTGHAIGVAGLPAVVDLRGDLDRHGRALRVSEQAVADELAAAASLVQGQAAEGLPVVLVRGFRSPAPHQGAGALLRPRERDLFR